MSTSTLLRTLIGLVSANLALTGVPFYNLRDHHIYNLEEHEARMDELEGTLRAHIGVIEESLDRIEGIAKEEDRGKTIDKLYRARGRDEKKSKDKMAGQSNQIPSGWEERQASGPGGRCYFVNVESQPLSTWLDPRRPITDDDPLPAGWEDMTDTSFRRFYFNKHTKTMTYEDPRLPQARPSEQLLRGNIVSDIWFYGQVPPPAPITASGVPENRAPPPASDSLTTSPAMPPPGYTSNAVGASRCTIPNGGGY